MEETMAEIKNQGRKVIQCPCGFLVEADGEQALVASAQEHARREHGMELTPEQALAMARPA
jgi:predicted small metal-binding protein